MITAKELQHVISYKHKKYRMEDNVFVVEGRKMFLEADKSNYDILRIYALSDFTGNNNAVGIVSDLNKQVKDILLKKYQNKIVQVSEKDLKRMSNLEQADNILTIVRQKEPKQIILKNNLILALDDINNPGNLGTIIRLAVWFGIKDIVCSQNTVEATNPKVLQSTMGAFFYINIFYTDFTDFLKQNQDKKIYGSVLLNGKNIYKEPLSKDGIIMIGNESHGINKKNLKFINSPITIPTFNKNNEAESLNASVACGIILSEFKRRTI